MQKTTQTQHHHTRRHDLDWLRVLAILLLVYFHTMMFYNTYGFHLKNAETTSALNIITTFLHQWRMPLLLVISGVGSGYAFKKRSTLQFTRERSQRLLIPLIFSMLVIVPPQIYLEKIQDYRSYFEFYPSIFEFKPYPEGNFSWHHMWFVMYLFLYSLICIPLVKLLRSENARSFKCMIDKVVSYDWGFMLYLIPILVSQILLRPYFPDETHALIDDWAYFTESLFFFAAGIIIAQNDTVWKHLIDRRQFHLVLALISLILMVVLMSIDWSSFQAYLRIDLVHIWHVNELIVAWTWVLTILGYGCRYLNRPSRLITLANEGIYPFYILHQTVLILLAYPLVHVDLNICIEYTLLSNLTVIISAAIYVLLIRPFAITRVVFGMKARQSKPSLLTDNEVRVISMNKHERNVS